MSAFSVLEAGIRRGQARPMALITIQVTAQAHTPRQSLRAINFLETSAFATRRRSSLPCPSRRRSLSGILYCTSTLCSIGRRMSSLCRSPRLVWLDQHVRRDV
jgi:hypothetical protein